MRYALVSFFLFIAWDVFPQQSAASKDFFHGLADCSTSLGGWKCLVLDLTSEASVENDSTKVYAYSWNFGDGTRKEGSRIEHCYDEFGSYQVTMDLIDSETNTVIRNELSSTVELYPEVRPVISSTTEHLPPGFMQFSCSYNDGVQFQPDRVYWRIDGSYYEGSAIVHSFPVAGVFLVEMGLEKNTDLFGTVTICSQTEITIKGSDIWTTAITDFVHSEREKTETGPFAASDIICMITPLSGQQKNRESLIPLSNLMREIDLRPDEAYELMLIAGNAFTSKKTLDTKGITGNDLYRALKDTVSSFLKQPLVFFPSVRFDKDVTTVYSDKAALAKTANLLLKNPFLAIEIGSYMHTGSRIVSGIETSLQRAQGVKDELVGLGVEPERISIASPEFNRALMNTCSTLPDCEREDESLNGIVEIKITGTSL